MTKPHIKARQRSTAHLKVAKVRPPITPKSIAYKSERECERRKRQIARGQLKEENGLIV